MPAIVSGIALMAVSFALDSPLWFVGCLLVGAGIGFATSRRGR